MTVIENYSDLGRKIAETQFELDRSGLSRQGFIVQAEISIKTYNKLSSNYWSFFQKSNHDDSPDRICGIPYTITQDTDRILIAKEIE